MAAKDRELELAKNDARAEMRSAGDDEDSTVIDQRAAESVKASPTPPRYKLYQRIIDRLPPWGLVIVLLALFGLVALTGGTKLAGWW